MATSHVREFVIFRDGAYYAPIPAETLYTYLGALRIVNRLNRLNDRHVYMVVHRPKPV